MENMLKTPQGEGWNTCLGWNRMPINVIKSEKP